MKYIVALSLFVSFNAIACSPQDYLDCPNPPVSFPQPPIIVVVPR